MITLFARDSWLWRVLYYAGLALQIVIGAITLDVMANPEGVAAGLAGWGISPLTWKWLSLVNPLVTAFAGKQGMSNFPMARNMGGNK